MRASTWAFAALAIAVGGAAPAGAGPAKDRGRFVTLPEGMAMGLEIEGIGVITRSDAGTQVKVVVRGLEPGTTYAAHLHNAPCSARTPAAATTRTSPVPAPRAERALARRRRAIRRPGSPPIRAAWPTARGSADWVARPEAQSVVIHSSRRGAPRPAARRSPAPTSMKRPWRRYTCFASYRSRSARPPRSPWPRRPLARKSRAQPSVCSSSPTG